MEALLLEIVLKLGYVGIFIATFVESTFVPIPSEVTMIPAGILVAKGDLSYAWTLISSTLGVIFGSCFNYWIGIRFGRGLLEKYGKYVFIKHEFLSKTERFFAKYGSFAVFIGRLLPGVRHYIAFAAGIANMRFKSFVIYTSVGGLIWMWILLEMGRMAEKNSANEEAAIGSFETIVIGISVITLLAWIAKKKLMKNDDDNNKR